VGIAARYGRGLHVGRGIKPVAQRRSDIDRHPDTVALESEPTGMPEALLHGTLVADARWGIAIRSEAAGGVIKVVWPHGYSAHPGPPMEVLDDAGRLVAREGDSVALPGGQEMDGRWQVCPGLAPLPALS
jgi:hypothetical protein